MWVVEIDLVLYARRISLVFGVTMQLRIWCGCSKLTLIAGIEPDLIPVWDGIDLVVWVVEVDLISLWGGAGLTWILCIGQK